MPKLLQINVSANWGSTGIIAEQISIEASRRGWDCYVAYGRHFNPSSSKLLKVGNQLDVYCHYIENRLLDSEGLGSRIHTYKLISRIKEIQPDIIHLHNIHDHWINYRILFKYLNKTDIPIVWTFHDFWAITGHCAHFISVNCDKWQHECGYCPLNKSLIDMSRRNFILKKELFSQNTRLHVVAVSEWVAGLTRRSFLGDKDIRVIPNGINVNVFNSRQHIRGEDLFCGKFVIMGVASQWKRGKGLDDYIKLSSLLKDDEIIVLVGVNESVKRILPHNIYGVNRTNSHDELAALYSRADVVTSFSSAETFGLTVIESYACGTPVVVYDNSAHPFLVTEDTGYVVPNGSYKAAYQAIQQIRQKGKIQYSKSCRKFVLERYDKDIVYKQYVDMYEDILNKS